MATEAHNHVAKHVAHHVHHALRHAAPGSSTDASIGSTILGVGVLIGLVLLIVFWARSSSRRAAASRAAAQAHFQELTSVPLSPIVVPELGLDPGETAFYAATAKVVGTHTRTRRVGYGGGPSFRIARGVYWHATSYTSTPVRETFTAFDDVGELIVTNERVIFVGAHNSLSWPLQKILSIHRFTDGVQINPINKKAMVFTTGSQDAGIIIDRARAGSLSKALGITHTEPA